jgi:hypothetical protein
VRLRVNGLQGHLDGIGVKVFGIPNVNWKRLRHIAIQSNRHRLLAQGKSKRTGCFAGLRRLIWSHVDCDVSARRRGLKTKRLWFWFDRHPTRHPGRCRSTRASRKHKNDDAIGRDGGDLPNSHETSSRFCGEPRLAAYLGRAGLRVSFGNVAGLLPWTKPRNCDVGNSLGLISMLDSQRAGKTQVRGVIDAQIILIGRLTCRARRGWSYNRSLEAHQACDSTAAHRHCRARSGDTEQASAGYAERHDATLKQPAVPAALTEIVMR